MVVEADGTDGAGGISCTAGFRTGSIITQQAEACFLVDVDLSCVCIHNQ